MKVIYWLAIFIVLLIIEIATMGLTTIWFAGGALIAFCAGFVGFGLGVQVGTFIVVSLLLLLLTRPLAVKYFNQERQKTNAESLIGQQALVTEDIDTIKAKGQVEIRGQIWSAKTDEPGRNNPEEHSCCSKWYSGRETDCACQRGVEYDFWIDFISDYYLRGDFLCKGSQTGAGIGY